MAIAFFIKTNQIPDVRRFFRKMKLMNVQPDVETFNIMLQGQQNQRIFAISIFHST